MLRERILLILEDVKMREIITLIHIEMSIAQAPNRKDSIDRNDKRHRERGKEGSTKSNSGCHHYNALIMSMLALS